MKAIVNTAPGKLEWLDWPTPVPGPGQVRIRVAACGVCATDLEMIAGWTRTGFPAIPGHEWAGTVDAVGPGKGLQPLVGKPCVAENVLSDGGEVGFEHPGGYGQFLITEANNVYPLPDDFPLWQAALIEPLAVCVHGLQRIRIDTASGPILIFGDGPIGLFMTALLSLRNLTDITLVGGRPNRLALGKQLGATEIYNYHTTIHSSHSSHSSHSPAFQTIIEASGSAAALERALELAAPGARILVLGDYKNATASFPWNHLLHRELELIGANASVGAWPEAVRLATSGEIELTRFVSARFPVERYAEAIERVRQRGSDAVKVVMDWAE